MFEQLVSEAASRFHLSTASVSSLMRGLLSLIADERTGGPEGFVNLFRHAALGDIISSWFGGKEGRTITPAHLEAVLGPSRIDRMTTSSGLPRAAVLSALAFLIPKVIGRLTPGGALPTASSLSSQVADYLGRPSERWRTMADDASLGREDHGPLTSATRIETSRAWGWVPWAAAAAAALGGLLWLAA